MGADAEGIEHGRRQFERRIPGGRPEDPNLRPRCRYVIEQAYDRRRIRLRVKDEGYSDDLRVWDGKRFFLQNRYADWPGLRPGQDGTLISRDARVGSPADLDELRALPDRAARVLVAWSGGSCRDRTDGGQARGFRV